MRRAILGVLVLILAGCGSQTGHPPVAGRPHSSTPVPYRPRTSVPSTFTALLGPELNGKLSVLSSKTGSVLRVVTSVGSKFTNNGLALSPDGRWIYATWIGKHSLRIERISAAGGPRTFIAYGSQPAISADGRYLGYITGKKDEYVAVRDLHSGRTRKWNLSPLIGNEVSLFNGQVLWSGAGELIVHPGEIAVATRTSAPAKSGKCSDASCLFHFDPSEAHPKLQLTRIDRGGEEPDFYSAGTAAPGSLIVSRWVGEKAEFALIDVSTGRRRHLVTFTGMPLALDRSGTHLLYLVGHSPPALWRAEIRGGRLTERHRLIASAEIFGGVAW